MNPRYSVYGYWWLLLVAMSVILFMLCASCVTRVTVCTTYDRRLGQESVERYARDNIGTSVCAELEPPPSRVRLEREDEEAEEVGDAGE